MGGWTGIWQWVVVLAIVLLLFGGRGKISALMGDIGKGLKSFKKGMAEGEQGASVSEGDQPKAIDAEAATVAEASTETDEAAKN